MRDGTTTPAIPRHRRSGRAAAAARRLAATALAVGALGLMAGAARAEELWTIRSGRFHLHFNVHLLNDLGIELDIDQVSTARADGLVLEEPYWTFPIQPGSDLRFLTEHGAVLPQGATAGTARLGGVLVLRDRASGKETRLEGLELAPVPAGEGDAPGARGAQPLRLRSAGTGLAVCELVNGMFDFRKRPEFQIHYLNARFTAAWAAAIGRPELAGWVFGLGEVRADVERLSVTPAAGPPREPVFAGGLLDVSLGELNSIQQVAHDGTYPSGATAVSMATTSCNLGTVDVPWLAPMDKEHPVIAMALYRLLDGRFEQIGVSWLKHGFYALSNSQCTPCQNPSDGSFLGVGCSDTYSVMNNASRNDLGPRNEVNAYAGTWECLASHFAGGQPDCVRRHGSAGHGPLDHRLVVLDAELANPGATYYYEACYVVEGDEKLSNNWGHRRCVMSWNGSAWSFATPSGNPLVEGPALLEWGDLATTVVVAPDDGEALLAVQASDLGGGTWHYEYALLNKNSDRQIRSFSLPVLGVQNIANIGFHDSDEDPSNDWQVSVDADSITWQTATFAQDPAAHALEFGTLYNFRFDADAAPASVDATLGLFKPGVGSEVPAATTGPANQVTAVGDAGPPGVRVIEIRPNPVSGSATIWYQASAGRADLSIYDATGRRVRTLVDQAEGAGVRSVVWDGGVEGGARARPGVYYARLRSGSVTAVRSVAIVD